MGKSLTERRELLEMHIFPKMEEPIRYSPVLEAGLKDLIQSVKAQGLEGLVAKRRDSKYEPGLRSGAWLKMRVNQGQELVIGGYTPSAKNFDALVIGYYEGPNLIYAARTRNGFTPASRAELFKKIKAAGNQRMPLRQPARKESWPMGRGSHGCQDGGMYLAEAAISCAI
jgi:ATP-dependent DNA ligase